MRVDGSIYDLTEKIELDKNSKHTVDIVVDRLVMKDGLRQRLGDSVETALRRLTDVLRCSLSERECRAGRA